MFLFFKDDFSRWCLPGRPHSRCNHIAFAGGSNEDWGYMKEGEDIWRWWGQRQVDEWSAPVCRSQRPSSVGQLAGGSAPVPAVVFIFLFQLRSIPLWKSSLDVTWQYQYQCQYLNINNQQSPGRSRIPLEIIYLTNKQTNKKQKETK